MRYKYKTPSLPSGRSWGQHSGAEATDTLRIATRVRKNVFLQAPLSGTAESKFELNHQELARSRKWRNWRANVGHFPVGKPAQTKTHSGHDAGEL